jgi:hypothetical protein
MEVPKDPGETIRPFGCKPRWMRFGKNGRNPAADTDAVIALVRVENGAKPFAVCSLIVVDEGDDVPVGFLDATVSC